MRAELAHGAHQRDDHRGRHRGHGDRRLRDHHEHVHAGRQRRRQRVGKLVLERLGRQEAGRQVARAEAAAGARVERDHAVARAVDRPVPLELRRRRLRVGLVEPEQPLERGHRAGRHRVARVREQQRRVAQQRGERVAAVAQRVVAPVLEERVGEQRVGDDAPAEPVVWTWSRQARPMFQSSVTSWSSKTM